KNRQSIARESFTSACVRSMIRSSRERNRSCSPVSCRSRGRIAHPPSIISRARNHSLRFEGIAKTICKKTAASPPNSGKNHYLERLNHPSRSTPWKYFTGDKRASNGLPGSLFSNINYSWPGQYPISEKNAVEGAPKLGQSQ